MNNQAFHKPTDIQQQNKKLNPLSLNFTDLSYASFLNIIFQVCYMLTVTQYYLPNFRHNLYFFIITTILKRKKFPKISLIKEALKLRKYFNILHF